MKIYLFLFVGLLLASCSSPANSADDLSVSQVYELLVGEWESTDSEGEKQYFRITSDRQWFIRDTKTDLTSEYPLAMFQLAERDDLLYVRGDYLPAPPDGNVEDFGVLIVKNDDSMELWTEPYPDGAVFSMERLPD